MRPIDRPKNRVSPPTASSQRSRSTNLGGSCNCCEFHSHLVEGGGQQHQTKPASAKLREAASVDGAEFDRDPFEYVRFPGILRRNLSESCFAWI